MIPTKAKAMAQSHKCIFELIGELSGIERIARGPSVRERARLRKQFGAGRWRKLKGVATVRLANGRIRTVEFALV